MLGTKQFALGNPIRAQIAKYPISTDGITHLLVRWNRITVRGRNALVQFLLKTPELAKVANLTVDPAFERYIGIDYSGAKTPSSSLSGLRVYAADRTGTPQEIAPPPSPRKYWNRREIAEWLVKRLSEGTPTLVGIDHGFSFPLAYFEQHGLPLDWPSFLDDFQRHWPTDEDIYVDSVRHGSSGNGAARSGNSRWRRLAELLARSAKSVFQFDMQGAVAKSTHAGIPWLRYMRRHVKDGVHFWPFEGWSVLTNRSVIAEVYPALWNRTFPSEGRTPDQDAFAIAKWMQEVDADGSLEKYFHPSIEPQERKRAEIEGWILGGVL